MKKIISLLFLSLFLNPMLLSASQSAQSDNVSVELISEADQIVPGKSFHLGLHFKLKPDWHIYWRNPGDSGIATHVDWVLPDGFTSESLKWPYPSLHRMDFLSVYGYENETMLMAEVKAPEALSDESYLLKANVKWLECAKVCIPGSADLEIRLPLLQSSETLGTKNAKLFSEAKSSLPIVFQPEAFRTFVNAHVLLLEMNKALFPKIKKIHFFPYQDSLIDHLAKQVISKSETHYQLWIPRSDLAKPFVEKIEGVLVNENGWRGEGSEKALMIELMAQPLAEDVRMPRAKANLSFSLALLFAFVGGLILNLMPCVFPVLSFKILNIVEIAQEKRSYILAHGIVFSLGVLISFWALAAALIALKTTGHQIGWGFHLQSPVMVALLALLFFVLSLNLWGVFEMGLSMTRLSIEARHMGPWVHTLGHGILATIVATPCTAPFMGTALGYALTQSNIVAFAVFTFLGLGMAFPYLLLSAFPSWIQKLPKPGPWMEKLKKILSAFLLMTFFWLCWVFWLQRGDQAFLLFVLAILSAAVFVRLYGQFQNESKKDFKIIALLLAALLTVAFLGLSFCVKKQSAIFLKHQSRSAMIWEDYSKEKLLQYLEEEHIIFLDFTAAWCLSCQVNEKVVFSSDKVSEAFREAGVKLLKADWTDKDEKVTQALAEFGRSSIPLYVFYFPGKKPILLPEIITPKIVLNILEENR